MEDWFHAILEHLFYNFNLDNEFVDINSFLTQTLRINSANVLHMRSLPAILETLRQKGYIDGVPQPIPGQGGRGNVLGIINHGAGFSEPNTLDTHRVRIRLTISGYDYIQDRERLRQQHESMIGTNRGIIIFGIFSILFTGVIAFVSILQYSKHDLDNRPELREIEKDIKELHIIIPQDTTKKIYNHLLSVKKNPSKTE